MRKLIPTLLALCLASVGARSQEVGRIDFRTAKSEPSWEQSLPQPSVDCGTSVHFGHSSGVAVGLEPLKIEVVGIEPRRFTEGVKMTATVRLQNVGDGPARIPWTLSPKDAKSQQDPNHSAYVWGEMSVVLVNQYGTKRKTRLAGTLPLFADSKNSRYWKTLKPGNWVSLTFEGSVMCPQKEQCGHLIPGEAGIVAEWMQMEVSTEGSGCGVQTAGMIQYEIESQPLRVQIAPSALDAIR